ncbi:MAG: hypothetical protein MK137_00915 [Rickettsiales bacterium]|nr:hypothetical protein [Rickettsiales bacterium]
MSSGIYFVQKREDAIENFAKMYSWNKAKELIKQVPVKPIQYNNNAHKMA